MNITRNLLLLTLIASMPLSAANYGTVTLTHLLPSKEDSTWVREKQVTPMYPKAFAMNGIVGCGVFEISLDDSGNTQNVSLVSSVPERIIFRPSKKVIESWRWQLNADKSASAETKILRLDYCMGQGTQQDVEEQCQAQATLACEQ